MLFTNLLTRLTLGLFRFVIVDEGTCQIITRFGRYAKTLRPGLRAYFSVWGVFGQIHSFSYTHPYKLEIINTTVLDMKEIVFDYPQERVISRDNVQFEIDAIVYFKIVDPKKALFSVDDYVMALRNTVQSILRAEIGEHTLEDCYSNRLHISEALTREADLVATQWGIDVIRLEIQEFDMGHFAEQLIRQKDQEIEKRQEILHAEGLMEAKIREAEGIKKAEILIAEGKRMAAESEAAAIKIRAEAEAEADKLKSEAEAYGFQIVAEVFANNPDVLERYLAFHTAEIISHNLAEGQSTKLFLPSCVNDLLKSFLIGNEVVKDKQV